MEQWSQPQWEDRSKVAPETAMVLTVAKQVAEKRGRAGNGIHCHAGPVTQGHI
jgi:hypothetical protein